MFQKRLNRDVGSFSLWMGVKMSSSWRGGRNQSFEAIPRFTTGTSLSFTTGTSLSWSRNIEDSYFTLNVNRLTWLTDPHVIDGDPPKMPRQRPILDKGEANMADDKRMKPSYRPGLFPQEWINIEGACGEAFDILWYHRHKQLLASGKLIKKSHDYARAMEEAKKIEKTYRKKTLKPPNDFELGLLSGKLSALRWVLGDEWDNLDT